MAPSKVSAEQIRGKVRNVIVLSLDACAANHLSCYGYSRNTTPNLDRLAAEGLRLSQFFCEYPNTAVNFRPIMISRYPEMNEHWATFPQLRKGDCLSIAEHFQNAGFATAGFSGNSFFAPRHGYAEGWDAFETHPEFAGHLRADAVCGMASKWLNAQGQRREKLFLWTHCLEPHNPYHAPAPYDHMFAQDYPECPSPDVRGEYFPISHAEVNRLPPNAAIKHVEAAYDGSLAFGDHHLGELLAQLQRMGLMENSAIIVTADHGEGWGEHNRYGHNNCIYDEEMKIPMIVRLPQSLGLGGRATDAIAESVDILPTLLDLAGIPLGGATPDGVSLLPLISGERDEAKPYVYGRAGQEANHTKASSEHVYSIRTRTHKLVWDTLTGRKEFYDIAADPGETRNRYAPDDASCSSLEKDLAAWMVVRRQRDTE